MQVLIAVLIVMAGVTEFRHIIGYATFGIIVLIMMVHLKRTKSSNDPKIGAYMIGGFFSISILFDISNRFITRDLGTFSPVNIALDEVVVFGISWILWVIVRKKMASTD